MSREGTPESLRLERDHVLDQLEALTEDRLDSEHDREA
jgi:hypothetical protein